MKILAIETSCDETGIAYVHIHNRTKKVRLLSENLLSQIDIHKEYGGVFPAVARREHAKIIGTLITQTLIEGKSYIKKTNIVSETKTIQKVKKTLTREPQVLSYFLEELIYIKKPNIDYIGVTIGPGLEPALWVGISTARALGILWNIPVIPINHMHGHIVSAQIDTKKLKTKEGVNIKALQYPVLSLLVSGGHTELILSPKPMKYTMLGKTRDDAAGECFDKCARMLGLSYPGGPEVSKLALNSRKNNIPHFLTLPRPMIHSGDFDFSYSGLKTALLYALRDLSRDLTIEEKKSVAQEIEESIVDVLVHKTIKALEKTKSKTLIVGGGVACNTWLKTRLTEEIKKRHLDTAIHFPDTSIATDNGVMIALATFTEIENSNIKKRYSWKAQGKMSL